MQLTCEETEFCSGLGDNNGGNCEYTEGGYNDGGDKKNEDDCDDRDNVGGIDSNDDGGTNDGND